jgi:hypothetical protein
LAKEWTTKCRTIFTVSDSMTDNSNKMPTDETLGRAQMDAEKRGKDIESDSRIAKKNQVSKDSQSTYASAAVPAVAAKWIVRILELEGRPELEKILQSDFGLRCCTGKSPGSNSKTG